MAKMTVNEVQVEIREPFKEGHVCTAGEADALNQTFRENVRNNVVGNIKRIEEKEKREVSAEEIQTLVTDYAQDYEFGVRSGPTRDPVESEALDLARERVESAIRAKNLNLKDFSAAKRTELAKNYLAGPAGAVLRERAKALVEARARVASETNLDEVQIPVAA